MENNLRFEKKFLIPPYYQNKIFDMILSNPYRFKESYKKRFINNIYLDDFNHNSAMDNINGNTIRSKFRLRWYGEKYGIKKSVIEKKYKRGNVGNKNFFEINDFNFSRNSNKFSIKSQIENKSINYFLKDAIKCFNPELFNSYSRRYFTSYDKKIRITIDYGIENYKINSISHFRMPDYENKNKMIMEIKYDNNLLLDISSVCQYFPFRQERFSKFIYGYLIVNA